MENIILEDVETDIGQSLNIKDSYDYVFIGTSILNSLEACYRASLGKSVLMVDRLDEIGGAWKSISLPEVQNAENAIHYFLPDSKGIEFMRDNLNWPIICSEGKFRFFHIPKLGYIKLRYDSKISQFFAKFLSEIHSQRKIKIAKLSLKIFLFVIRSPRIKSFYIENGSNEMLTRVSQYLAKNKVCVSLNSNISEIYFDKTSNTVISVVNGTQVYSKSITLGHGARLPPIKYNEGEILFEESKISRPAYHLLISDNKKNRKFECVLNDDDLIKYVHDVTRFSSLKCQNGPQKKLFVFGLQPDSPDDPSLAGTLHQKLIKMKLVHSHSKVISQRYSDLILPTLNDNDLKQLENKFGDMVNVLRTENFAKAMGLYADRWSQIFPKKILKNEY